MGGHVALDLRAGALRLGVTVDALQVGYNPLIATEVFPDPPKAVAIADQLPSFAIEDNAELFRG